MMAHAFHSHRKAALAGALALLLGAGLTSALATSASSAPASRAGHRATTSLQGFRTAPATVQVRGTVTDQVGVRPRAHRVVRIQARRPGSKVFHTVSSGFSDRTGNFQAVYRPTTVGAWRFRLFLPATASATQVVSPSRTVTATAVTDATAPAPVTAATVVQGTGSDLTLSWANPTDPDFAGVIIRRAVGATAPASPTDGALVTHTDAAATSFTDTGLAGDTRYSYALFAVDGVGNKATAATIAAVSGAATTASLSLNGSTGSTAKQTAGLSEAFVIDGTHAGKGLSLVSGTLDYGDGTGESFTGDPSTWVPAVKQYSDTGTKTATWTVVDSAAHSVTTSLEIHVFAEPSASISVVTQGPLEQNKPVQFAITSDTPTGTAFTDYDTFTSSDGATFDNIVHDVGKLPGTLTLTFPSPGTYTVFVDSDNDAGGFAAAEVQVVIIDAGPTP